MTNSGKWVSGWWRCMIKSGTGRSARLLPDLWFYENPPECQEAGALVAWAALWPAWSRPAWLSRTCEGREEVTQGCPLPDSRTGLQPFARGQVKIAAALEEQLRNLRFWTIRLCNWGLVIRRRVGTNCWSSGTCPGLGALSRSRSVLARTQGSCCVIFFVPTSDGENWQTAEMQWILALVRRRPAVHICWLAPHLACPWLWPNSDSEAWTSPRVSMLLTASWGSCEDVEMVTAEPDTDVLPSQPFCWLLLSPQVLNVGVQWGSVPHHLLGLDVFCLQIHTCTDPFTPGLQSRSPEPQTVLYLPPDTLSPLGT